MLLVRPMQLPEVDLVIDYFHKATPDHLALLGVDPKRLPAPALWRQFYELDDARPLEHRQSFLLLWLAPGSGEVQDQPIGFSSIDKIQYGEHAFMHLHLFDASNRAAGRGSAAVRQSVDHYFKAFALKRLFCEPHAFNQAPNRTLQRVGFKYIKTYMTVPGPLNFHQAVNLWGIER